ncbi:MAG: metallophosphoesterase [Candidatus Brocadiia bacterium]
MLIGVVSDTHDNLLMARRAVSMLQARGAEAILHAGDFVAPFALKVLLSAGVPLIAVLGNNDGEVAGLSALCDDLHEPPYRFDLGGRQVVLTHDEALLTDELCAGADLIVCGHSHAPKVQAGPPLRVNPGEAGGWLSGRCTAAMVDLDAMEAEIVELGTQETVPL